MQPFTGLHNFHGTEYKFIIYLNPAPSLEQRNGYMTDFFQGKNRSDAFVYDTHCVIGGISYDYHFIQEGSELLFVAREAPGMYDILSCFWGPNFMLGTDKVEV